MIGYIIGVILGILVFLFQNLKPTSLGFRFMYLVASICFILGLYFAGIGLWNLLAIPVGEFVLAFVSAFIFPFTEYSKEGQIKGWKTPSFGSSSNQSSIKYLNEFLTEFSNELEKLSDSSFIDRSVFGKLIKLPIENWVKSNKNEFCKIYDNDPKAEKKWILFQINNISGNELESGNHHLYRGMLNDEGSALMRIFRLSSDEIVKMNVKNGNGEPIDAAWASKNLAILRQNIASVG